MKQEDYLETIYKLGQQSELVRISDIATELKLRKPSVTEMVQRLQKDGYVRYKPYYPVTLTKRGRGIGKSVAERHAVLSEFFTLLGIPNKIQEHDIHGIEHHLSPITLQKLRKVTAFLRKKRFG